MISTTAWRLGLAGLLLSVSTFAQTSPEVSRTEALVKLCEVWSTVKFFDPQLMTRKVDWDGALVRAVPKMREARTSADVAGVIGSMLAELEDPATRVFRKDERRSGGEKVPLLRWEGEVLVVSLGPYVEAAGETFLYSVDQEIAPEVAKAKSVVFDLRTRSAETPGWILEMLPLVNEPVPVPPWRQVVHSGYAPQTGTTSGRYYSGLQILAESPLAPPRFGASTPSRLVVIVGGEVPARAAALWWSGRAALVAEHPLSDGNVARTRPIDLGGGWMAAVRVSEPVVQGLAADAVVPPVPGEDGAVQKALALARDPSPLPARPAQRETTTVPIPLTDSPYAEMTDPDLPYRLLGLFRLWSVIDLFYPYKSLLVDWDAVLREFIPRFEAAKDGKEYALTAMELVTRIEDGHSSAWGPRAIWDLIGVATVPLEVRSIEGQFLVTGKGELLPKDAPVAIGDEVVSIDGELLVDRVRRLWKYLTASNEAARTATVLAFSLRGPRNSTAELVVAGPDGKPRTVKIARTGFAPMAASGEVWRILPGNLGYVDLTRLTVDQIDDMLGELDGAKAIIFDMRGYPNGTGWPIAPRLNTRDAAFGAVFCRPQLPASSPDQLRSLFCFEQVLEKTKKPKYTGRTVMLIDERTISQAEHAGLLFEAANGTRFIGSNSAGAIGDVTSLVLPGGLYVNFTGYGVSHADGRPVQRIGLVPDVEVRPTVRGIREGRDEVLERAIAFLEP